MKYDSANSGLAIETHVNFRKYFKLLAVHDPTNQPDCSFMLPVEIPMDISVCGDEVVSIVNSGPEVKNLEFGIDADISITKADLLAMITISNHCIVKTMELSIINTVTPSNTGAPWATWITLDSNSDM